MLKAVTMCKRFTVWSIICVHPTLIDLETNKVTCNSDISLFLEITLLYNAKYYFIYMYTLYIHVVTNLSLVYKLK